MTIITPTGIVTFLFTDIEGSTRRWEADADAMRVALELHNETLRREIEAHAGHVFNYTGDGMCAVFASPRSAVDAAIGAQRALELPVRMGICTGEAELHGGEYFGTALNRTARVMAAGHGGQILIDGLTASLLSGVELISLGPRRLRDIAMPVELYQVRAAGLGADFPALKTVDATPGNLRPPTSSFIGRQAELFELQTALKAHRLVTLTGVGGVGKTRLALETAARSAHEFYDGVFVIELAAVGDPAAVPDAVAAALGIIQHPGKSVTESVAGALDDRSRLLLFDNCEHVLDAAADLIEAILARSTTVRVLATSREGLGLADEQLWPVPSLDTGRDSTAAELFVERASAVAPGISMTDAGDAVVEICRRLDGIPLAIELAASRLQSMTVTEVRDRLDERFRLLVGSRRGLERHQTLRHAVQWSYDLLNDAERALLQHCSVFAGGFDLAGACAVSGATDDYATLDVLDALVRKSLLVANRSATRTRFSMLETIRQFAEEQLASAGEADAVRTAHCHYFAGVEEAVFALWESPRQREGYAWMYVELANLRTAFRWAIDHDDLDAAAAITTYAGTIGFWGEQHEPIRWVEELIEPARAVQHRRLAQLYTLAALCFTAGRIEDSIRYAEAGQAAIRSGRFDQVRKNSEASLGACYGAVGEVERWIEWARYILERRPESRVHAQGILTIALKMSGDDKAALDVAEGLLAAADTVDEPNMAAWALFAFGTASREADPAAAYDALRRGLVIAQDSGSWQTGSSIASMLAPLAIDHGKTADALHYVSLATRNYYDSGNSWLVKSPLSVLMVLLYRLGRYEPAAVVGGFAADTFTQSALQAIATTVTQLRERFGDEAFDSLARTGELMTTAEMVKYAFEQIELARADLE